MHKICCCSNTSINPGEKMISGSQNRNTVNSRYQIASILFVALLLYAINLPAEPLRPGDNNPAQQSNSAPDNLHQDYDRMLRSYVVGKRFNYAAIYANKADLQALSDYVDRLENQNPAGWNPQEALAFWINLYNAATLELVLKHYPLDSIKDIGGFFSSPWNKKVVTVAGRKLTLNQIENDIIRPQFGDARIHFALNCASIGCPPLFKEAYEAEKLNTQLDSVTRSALNDRAWVEVRDKKLVISKIFDWYEDDFKADGSSVRQFISRYREDDAAINDRQREIDHRDYDWRLNRVE